MNIHPIKVKSYTPAMPLQTVSFPNPIESFPLLQEVFSVYSSELTYNNWTSFCLNYYPGNKNPQLNVLINLLTTIALVPIIMCSGGTCEPCPTIKTFGIDWTKLRLSLRLNSSFAVDLYHDPFCRNPCRLKKRLYNGESDLIRIYLDNTNSKGTAFTWKSLTYVSGQKGAMLRVLVGSLSNPVQFVGPRRSFKVRPLQVGYIKSVAPFHLQNISSGNVLSTDFSTNEIPHFTATNRSRLYPVIIETYRAVIIQPKRQFRVDKMMSLGNAYFLIGFSAYLMFSYIVRKLLFEDPTITSFFSYALQVLYETAGVASLQQHHLLSVYIVKAFYCFFVYIYFVTCTGRIVSLMSSAARTPKITSLDTIKYSDMDIILSVPFHLGHPGLIDLVRERLREPLQITSQEVKEKIQTTDREFVAIINDKSARAFLENMLPDQRYYLVTETLGE